MADAEWTADDLAALPAWTLVRTYHAIAQGFGELFAEHKLSPVQFGVLAQLAAAPGLTQSELARRVLIRPQSMAELIGTLVGRGLLERQGPGGRGRPVPVVLTDLGRSTLAQAGAAVREFNRPAALGLTGPEARTLNELLHKLLDSRQASR